MLYQHSTTSANTFLLTEQQFVTAESSDYSVNASLGITVGTSNEVGFEVF